MYENIYNINPIGKPYPFETFDDLYENNIILPDDGEIEYVEVNGFKTNIYVKSWGGYIDLPPSKREIMTYEELKQMSKSNDIVIYWVGD